MTAVSDIFSIGPAGRAVRGSGEIVHCFCMQLINGNRVRAEVPDLYLSLSLSLSLSVALCDACSSSTGVRRRQ